MAGGLPYNLTTESTIAAILAQTTDRPIINGVIVGRNTGRGTPVYYVDPFIERSFPLGTDRVHLDLRAEAFNVNNHANFVTFNGTYGTGTTAPSTLGTPGAGVTAQLPARQLQFLARIRF